MTLDDLKAHVEADANLSGLFAADLVPEFLGLVVDGKTLNYAYVWTVSEWATIREYLANMHNQYCPCAECETYYTTRWGAA